VLTAEERALLREVGRLVSTPRSAKRLVNIYRMLRVSVPPQEVTAFKPDGGQEYQAVVVLLAILVGRPALARDVLTAVMEAKDDEPIWPVLTAFAELCEPLNELSRLIALTRAAPFRRWAPRVSRFSFTSRPRCRGTTLPSPRPTH